MSTELDKETLVQRCNLLMVQYGEEAALVIHETVALKFGLNKLRCQCCVLGKDVAKFVEVSAMEAKQVLMVP